MNYGWMKAEILKETALARIPPSLVGGVLVPQNTLDERKAQRILDGKPIHSTEIRGSEYGEKEALPVVAKIVDSKGGLSGYFWRIRKGLKL